jgi:hypothetical protein
MLPPLGRPIPVPWCGRSKKGMKKERRKVVKKRKKESKQKKQTASQSKWETRTDSSIF